MKVQRGRKFYYIVTLGILYFISFWLLTIGYFTPVWIKINLESGAYDEDYNRLQIWERLQIYPDYSSPPMPLSLFGSQRPCTGIGLVRPTLLCHPGIYNWIESRNVKEIGYILKNAFILMTTAIAAVYVNAILLVAAIVFNFFQKTLYMSFLSISFGVLYPAAAILILVATTYVEASFTYDSGYSVMLCSISGSLMFIFYVGLIWYDMNYKRLTKAT